MTVIVGLVADGQVWIGGDCLGAYGDTVEQIVTPKVFARGSYLIGFSASYRVGQLLHYGLTADNTGMPEPPALGGHYDDDDALEAHMVNDWAGWVRRLFADHGIPAWRRNDSDDEHVSALVAVQGRLFDVSPTLAVLRTVTGYATRGNASDLALGSLHTSQGQPADQRVIKALRAAAQHSATVGEPFTVLRQPVPPSPTGTAPAAGTSNDETARRNAARHVQAVKGRETGRVRPTR